MSFKALVNTTIRKRRVVTKKRYLELAENDREWFSAGWPSKDYYREILPPSPNPKLALLREKLNQGKMQFTETPAARTVDGVERVLILAKKRTSTT